MGVSDWSISPVESSREFVLLIAIRALDDEVDWPCLGLKRLCPILLFTAYWLLVYWLLAYWLLAYWLLMLIAIVVLFEMEGLLVSLNLASEWAIYGWLGYYLWVYTLESEFQCKKGRFYGYENRKILLRQLFIWLFRGNAIYALIFVAYSLSSLIAHNLVAFRVENDFSLVRALSSLRFVLETIYM